MIENMKFKGEVTICLTDENGVVKDQRTFPNLVVTTGTNFVASRMGGTTPAVMSHIAVGTTNTAPVVANTTLATELTRVALTAANVVGSTITYTATLAAGVGTGALVEAGIFNAASAGTMLARTVYAVINKGASDVLNISWTISAA